MQVQRKNSGKDNILQEIVGNKRIEVELRKKEMPLESFVGGLAKSRRSFLDAVRRKDGDDPRLIAEIKPASPSAGKIREIDEDEILRIAGLYNEYADAISVLTDTKFFGGSVDNLRIVTGVSKVPVLRKDFIIDGYQIYEARYYGADAVLLIVSLLDIRGIKEYMRIAAKLGMECLVEVHDRKELDVALKAGCELIGINNRNLATMTVNLGTTIELIRDVPDDVVVVSESGIRTKDDIMHLSKAGIDAVLVGTAIMDGDVERNLEKLTGALP